MDNNAEVQQFLTAARGRISPERAGVPMFGGKRRVPGLRREEVAQLAGVSLTYYTRMERGDLGGVSESVLRATARALQLDGAETAHLLDLGQATTGPVHRPSVKRDSRVAASITRLIDTMRDVPVVAQNPASDPVASNALGRALFPHLFPENHAPVNHARYMFLDPRARDFYTDWEGTARGAVSAMRLSAGHDPDDRALTTLIGELVTRSPEFRTWWSSHTVRIHNTGRKDINHPVVGQITLTYDVLALPAQPGIGITTYLPEPGSPSADALNLLRSWTADTGLPTRSSDPTPINAGEDSARS